MEYKPLLQSIQLHPEYQTDVLRLDLIHPEISGNKWFKLIENINKAKRLKQTTLLTFGGAYSNHLAATASVCNKLGLNSIGIVRGDATESLNATLQKASEKGMRLHFVTRAEYSQKTQTNFINQLHQKFGAFYLIPEGGHNIEGLMGCKQILKPEWNYDYVCCACGTGTTFAGLVASENYAKIIGISVLKGTNTLPAQVLQLLSESQIKPLQVITGNEALDKEVLTTHVLTNHYCFKGYASYDEDLIVFKTEFEKTHNLALDYVYTSKLFFAINDLALKQKFKAGSKILILHSGGLQGNVGFEKRYHLTLNR